MSKLSIVGNGRQLPQLLFLTNSDALAVQVGVDARDIAMVMVTDAALKVVDTRSHDMGEIANEVTAALQQHPACEGVVILGGHDVIPHGVYDVVAGTQYQKFVRRYDELPVEGDEFVVWSDDVYGYRQDGESVGDVLLPELPVSRIPDARSEALLIKALEAAGATHEQMFAGIRRVSTSEYAAKVHHSTFGSWTDWLTSWFRPSPMTSSEPVTSDQPADVQADVLYLALHGETEDAALYGETKKTLRRVKAITPDCLPNNVPNVILAAACWSALVVNMPADMAFSDFDVRQKLVDESLALTLLSRGARAVIGCTSILHLSE